MAIFISHSPEETAALGENWGRQAESGWVIGIVGDLGAGKTQLVKGIARGLGIQTAVQSPTFNLVNLHAGGRFLLAHLDFYRLAGPQEIIRAGLEDYLFRPAGVTVVEWIDRWLADNPRFQSRPVQRYRHVHIDQPAENQRRIVYEDSGS